ncbi:hypothetical protein Pcinc_014844 [Petrolisthes cinctipes]|uniref:Fibronectin type-III domain-containing protein n=1 Tax=Petrolisthes cinctipes TaxID=88211 RepID=A0AAE1KRE5_PETCI|nr:hypothetical protein Pcinc_014844 [Petrolisthes cinctipes]
MNGQSVKWNEDGEALEVMEASGDGAAGVVTKDLLGTTTPSRTLGNLHNVRATYVEVSAAPSGTTSVAVQWLLTDSSVSDQVASYIISWSSEGEDGTDSVDNTYSQYTIMDLVPCTTYTITVQPTDVDSAPLGDPGPASASTATQGVLPVSSVTPTAVPSNSHHLEVSWTLSLDIGRCPGYYKVTWSGKQNGEAGIQGTTSYTITDLDTWTTYNVCVDSGDDADNLFGRPKCEEGTTDEDIPGSPPTDIATTSVTEDSLTVQWGPPQIPNGVIVNYKVTWSPDDGTADTTEMTYKITGLLPCSSYTVSVSAVTSKGNGPSGDTSNSTQPAVPGAPGDVIVAMAVDRSDSLDVTWTQAEAPGKCDITSNIVSWSPSSAGVPLDTMTLDPTESYTITGLDPWTTYLVCVRASTLGGDGPDAPCVNMTTDEDVPGPPQNLNVMGSTTPESITVKWDPPSSPNGVISYYSLTWNPDDPSDNVITNDTTYTLTDLLPCTIYTISVSAATSKGSGDPSNITGATQSATPGAPADMTVTMVLDKSDSLDVTWTQPSSTCDITNNTISWLLSNTGDLVDSETIDATESYTIIGLDPWTTYLVCVSASTLAGEGPEGPCVNQTTDEDVPTDPPENLQVKTATPDSIELQWDSPGNPNGVIINYSIMWSPDNGTVDTPLTTYTLTDLQPCTVYTVDVMASTSKGYGPPADILGITQPGADEG